MRTGGRASFLSFHLCFALLLFSFFFFFFSFLLYFLVAPEARHTVTVISLSLSSSFYFAALRDICAELAQMSTFAGDTAEC